MLINEDSNKNEGVVKQYVKVLLLPFLIIVLSIFFDQLTKVLIFQNGNVILIDNWLEFYCTLNNGAAFGLLSGTGAITFFIVITIPIVLAIGFFIVKFRNGNKFLIVALALTAGGAVGNLIDRIMLGGVRDFVHFIYGGFDLPLVGRSFAIFNIADSCLVVGEIMLVVYLLFMYVDKNDKKAVEKQQKKQELKHKKKIALEDKRNADKVVSVEKYLNSLDNTTND